MCLLAHTCTHTCTHTHMCVCHHQRASLSCYLSSSSSGSSLVSEESRSQGPTVIMCTASSPIAHSHQSIISTTHSRCINRHTANSNLHYVRKAKESPSPTLSAASRRGISPPGAHCAHRAQQGAVTCGQARAEPSAIRAVRSAARAVRSAATNMQCFYRPRHDRIHTRAASLQVQVVRPTQQRSGEGGEGGCSECNGERRGGQRATAHKAVGCGGACKEVRVKGARCASLLQQHHHNNDNSSYYSYHHSACACSGGAEWFRCT
jgi:hypothetical protein